MTDAASSTLLAVLLLAAVGDVRSRKIPNRLILSGLALSLGFVLGGALPLGQFLGGLLLGGCCFLPLYLRGVLGAGDVKLMALAGSFLGLKAALVSVLLTTLSGGALALFYLGFMSSTTLPYAAAILLGVSGYLWLVHYAPHALLVFFGPLGTP